MKLFIATLGVLLACPVVLAADALSSSSCDREPSLRSAASSSATEILFINESPTQVQIFWVDFNGVRKLYSVIRPHERVIQQTYVGHPWVVADMAGRCVAVYWPADKPAEARVRDGNVAARPTTADLRIVSQPGSVQAYVDDRFKGVTSEGEGVLVVENLAPGTHRIRLSLPSYKEWRQEVTLTASETLEVTAKLVSAGPAPLSLDEVDEALTNGVPKKRVIALVNQFGVDFALTKEVEQRLRKGGADSDLLLLITKSKK